MNLKVVFTLLKCHCKNATDIDSNFAYLGSLCITKSITIIVTITLPKVPRYVKSLSPRNTYSRGRLSTVDLLIKVACFVKNKLMFAKSKAANLN
jgi:hypothetical protein